MNIHKDPAVPFYTADWILGTADLTWEEKGIYITLLCLQHSKGHLSDKIISLNIKREVPPDVMKKFIKDKDGFWYNERLEHEMQKRKRFKEKQSENVKLRWNDDTNSIPELYQTDTKNIPLVNENVNRNKEFKIPKEEEVVKYFEEKGYRTDIAKKAFLYYSEMDWHDSRGKPIKNWKGKMVAVWFKDEHRQIVAGKVNLTQLSNERKNHTS